MNKVIIKIDGMRCGMCEAHINDLIRKICNPKKVKSSHKKGISTIQYENDIDFDELKAEIEKTGYKVLEINKE